MTNICVPDNFFSNDICRNAKLQVDSGIIEPQQCVSECSKGLPNCESVSITEFCTRQPEIQYLYTFHSDPILYKWQLGNRNWAGPDHPYINAIDFDIETNPTHKLKASSCIYDSMGHGNLERTYFRSYNYLTRIKIKPGSLPLKNTNYEKAEDCSCTEMKNEIPGIQNNRDSPGYSVCANKPNYILNSPWVSLSQNWINKNISVQDFQTTYLTTNDQNWYDPKYGFKTKLDQLCASPSINTFIQFRTFMDELMDEYFFSSTTAVPVELVTPENYSSLPNFCTGANLNGQLKSTCEINISSDPPTATPTPAGYIGWGCADSGYCEATRSYSKFDTTYHTLKQCVDSTNCSYQGGTKTCGCSDQCQLTNYNRCYDLYQQKCKGNANCLQCTRGNLPPECYDFIVKYVCANDS